jgi:1-acyl-sn-glycerol-3-phosphate acyltransferase
VAIDTLDPDIYAHAAPALVEVLVYRRGIEEVMFVACDARFWIPVIGWVIVWLDTI